MPSRRRWRQVARAGKDSCWNGRERVLLWPGEHGKDESTTRYEDAPALVKSGRGIRHEHEAPTADHAVERSIVQLHRLCIEHLVVDILNPELGASLACDVDHGRCNVGRDEASRAETFRGKESGIARTRGDLQYALAVRRLEVLDKPLVDRARRREHASALLVPAAGL